MKKLIFATMAVALLVTASAAVATVAFGVKLANYDPSNTRLVATQWISGIGCPKGAIVEEFVPPNFDTTHKIIYTDAACTTGDLDKNNEGLLLAKTGPSNNNAAAAVSLTGIKKGTKLTELGFDLRKSGSSTAGAAGSHCSGGAARFNIVLSDDPNSIYFLGCNSGVVTASSSGWLRLRWTGPTITAYQNGSVATNIYNRPIKSIDIIFDEGQDPSATPDMFGIAVLDNLDFNGSMVGRAGYAGQENDPNGAVPSAINDVWQMLKDAGVPLPFPLP